MFIVDVFWFMYLLVNIKDFNARFYILIVFDVGNRKMGVENKERKGSVRHIEISYKYIETIIYQLALIV